MPYSDTNNFMQALPSECFVFYIAGSVEHKHWGTKTNYSPVKWQQGWAQLASEKIQYSWLHVKVWPTQVCHSLEECMNTEIYSSTGTKNSYVLIIILQFCFYTCVIYTYTNIIEVVHLKITIQSSFTQPHDIPNLYALKKHEDLTWIKQILVPLTSVVSPPPPYSGSQRKPKVFDCQQSSKYHSLCSTEERKTVLKHEGE